MTAKAKGKSINLGMGAGLALLGVVIFYQLRKDTMALAEGVVTAVNPTDHDNIFSRGTNAVGDALDGGGDNDSFSLGAWWWETLHGGQDNAENVP